MPDQNIAAISSVSARLAARVEAGTLTADPAQQSVAGALDGLLSDILAAGDRSILSRLTGRKKLQRGLYIHGGVGRGKTMLMDIFFDLAPDQRKTRAHFHEFMADVHDRINRFRTKLKAGEVKGDDPIPPVAREIAAETRLLC
ncbi:MAG: AFG1/ZapE family ATPase, partial [Candidatus Puniceispirillaceae bacterium]